MMTALSNDSLSHRILQGIVAPIDHSPSFTSRVQALGSTLSAVLGNRPCRHDHDMNYNPGQYLAYTVDGKPGPVEVRYYISSKAPLYAVYIIDTEHRYLQGDIRHPVPLHSLPPAMLATIDAGKEFLVQAGYQEVPFEYFFADAPSATTQIDDLPAKVFEALFAEIV